MRLLLLAPPGAGKGTQGERLAGRLGVQHVSAGELLRAEARAGTPAGREVAAYQQRGDLVPDPIVCDVLTAAVIRHRLEVFATTTSPLIAYYRDRGILLAVDADRRPEAVTAEILTRMSERSPIRGTP